MPLSAPVSHDVEPLDDTAAVLAAQLTAQLDGHVSDAAVLALVLALAEVIVASTPPAKDTYLLTLLHQHLTRCVARLRALPPLE